MERAAKLLRQSKLAAQCVTEEDLARAAWPSAVGKRLAARTRASHMVRGRLVVEVEDQVWRQQLYSLRELILRNLRKSLGAGVVETIEFRASAPRIPVRSEGVPAGAGLRGPLFAPKENGGDEADGIEDPMLRLIYKESRKKAKA